MDNAARTRQRVLALFLPIAAVLYISAEALSPKGTDQVITTTATALNVLSIAARHPAQLYVAGSFALLGLGALAVSYAAIAALVRGRGSALATVAALIGEPRRRRDGTPDAGRGRAVPQSHARVVGNAQQHPSVAGQEAPVRHARTLS